MSRRSCKKRIAQCRDVFQHRKSNKASFDAFGSVADKMRAVRARQNSISRAKPCDKSPPRAKGAFSASGKASLAQKERFRLWEKPASRKIGEFHYGKSLPRAKGAFSALGKARRAQKRRFRLREKPPSRKGANSTSTKAFSTAFMQKTN